VRVRKPGEMDNPPGYNPPQGGGKKGGKKGKKGNKGNTQ